MTPAYQEWEEGLKDKLLFNADWYDDADERRRHARQVAYVKPTVQGKAFDHLISYLRQFDENQVVTVEMCCQYLKRVLDNPNRCAKARDELREFKLNYPGDFNTFYSEFIHLANLSSKIKDLWRGDP